MMGRGLRISLILCILAAGCRPGLPAVVDFPHYAFRNSTTLELMRVERTDTATVFSMRAYYIPGWWFTIDTTTCLYADGRRYPLHAASGIVPGTHEYIREAQLPGDGRCRHHRRIGLGASRTRRSSHRFRRDKDPEQTERRAAAPHLLSRLKAFRETSTFFCIFI